MLTNGSIHIPAAVAQHGVYGTVYRHNVLLVLSIRVAYLGTNWATLHKALQDKQEVIVRYTEVQMIVYTENLAISLPCCFKEAECSLLD